MAGARSPLCHGEPKADVSSTDVPRVQFLSRSGPAGNSNTEVDQGLSLATLLQEWVSNMVVAVVSLEQISDIDLSCRRRH